MGGGGGGLFKHSLSVQGMFVAVSTSVQQLVTGAGETNTACATFSVKPVSRVLLQLLSAGSSRRFLSSPVVAWTTCFGI